jgi:hypothetical protein
LFTKLSHTSVHEIETKALCGGAILWRAGVNIRDTYGNESVTDNELKGSF